MNNHFFLFFYSSVDYCVQNHFGWNKIVNTSFIIFFCSPFNFHEYSNLVYCLMLIKKEVFLTRNCADSMKKHLFCIFVSFIRIRPYHILVFKKTFLGVHSIIRWNWSFPVEFNDIIAIPKSKMHLDTMTENSLKCSLKQISNCDK